MVALLSNQQFVGALWDTVTSREIQYRMRMSYLEARQLLVQHGVPRRFCDNNIAELAKEWRIHEENQIVL